MASIISFTVPCTPEKFRAVNSKLHMDPDTTTGTLGTNDVDLDYQYDGTAQTLSVQVTKLKSMKAKWAPHSVIQQHITDLFNQS